MKIVTVVPLKKGLWKEDLTYFSMQDVPDGSIVTIPFRNKKVLGLVTGVENAGHAKSSIKSMSFNLKKIINVKEHSVFRKEYLNSIIETSKYFVSNKNNGITSLIPAVFRENYDKLAEIQNLGAELPFGSSAPKSLKPEKILFQVPFDERISSYKTLIRGSFAQKKSVFIVLPTQFDIDKFTNQLSKGIEQFTFSIHSGINVKKNILTYEKIMTSLHPILIIGTPPFLSIPRHDIETIILEHESSSAYRMIVKPHFDLRVFTEIYASKINARFIMAAEMLRFETIGRKDLDNLNPLHPLSFRINFDGEIEIFGKASPIELQPREEKFKIFKEGSIEEIKYMIARKKNV